MSWKVSCVMEERMRFVVECRSGNWSMAEVCRRCGISRKTGYKWLERYGEGDVEGLKDRARAPWSHPNAVDAATEHEILAFKRAHILWGPGKLLAKLQEREPQRTWPAASTIGDMLKRHGLVVRRRKRNHATSSSQPLAHCAGANDVWCADFKGWFRTGDGKRCDPLTITDASSRFILCCQAMSGKTGFFEVKPLFEATFRAVGLPRALRTDNGPPFASTGLGGLSRLSVWWIRLGITPERIQPGKPQENGRHERMHRTLKQATANPPQPNHRAQQRTFDHFVEEFNYERPHEALGQQPPASHYQPSPRIFPSRLPELPSYPDPWETRNVRGAGQMKWRGHDVCISQALVGQCIGLKPIDDGLWEIYFAHLPLAIFDERRLRVKRRDTGRRK